jgi:hypothetical protein
MSYGDSTDNTSWDVLDAKITVATDGSIKLVYSIEYYIWEPWSWFVHFKYRKITSALVVGDEEDIFSIDSSDTDIYSYTPDVLCLVSPPTIFDKGVYFIARTEYEEVEDM